MQIRPSVRICLCGIREKLRDVPRELAALESFLQVSVPRWPASAQLRQWGRSLLLVLMAGLIFLGSFAQLQANQSVSFVIASFAAVALVCAAVGWLASGVILGTLPAVLQVIRAVAMAVLFAGAAVSAIAQTNPDLEQGMKPYGSFQGGSLDHIALSNGNAFFEANLLTYSQRGDFSYPIVLRYNNENFSTFVGPAGCSGNSNPCLTWIIFNQDPSDSRHSLGAGMSIGYDGLPNLLVNAADTGLTYYGQPISVNVYSVQTPDGSMHTMVNTDSNTMAAIDGSLWHTDATLRDGNGNKFNTSSSAEDTNGNQITLSGSTWTDTLGRQIPIMPGPAHPADTPPASTASLSACPALNYANQPVTYAYLWSLPAPNSGSLTLTLCYTSVWVHTNFFGGPAGSRQIELNQNFTMLQSVVLPDNTYWAFAYDAAIPTNSSSYGYGDLLKVTFPMGGSISYAWVNRGGCTAMNPPINRAVISRSVDANDGNGPRTWNYSYSDFSSANSNATATTTVTDPLGNDIVHTFTGLGVTCSQYETLTQDYQGSHTSGTLLKSVQTDYQYTGNPYDSRAISSDRPNLTAANVFPIRMTTTLANGLVSKTETDYDNALAYHGPLDGITSNTYECPTYPPNGQQYEGCFYGGQTTQGVTNYTGSYGKVIATREYDWGQGAPGPLLRQTFTNYLWQSNSSYLANNFLDLVSSTTVQDGSGSQVAQTTYGYDEYALNSSGISTQHNASPVNGSYRGNQTSAHHWLNGGATATAGCPVSVSNGSLVSYAQYNDTGTVYKTTDACGSAAGDPSHTTTHTYSSAYAGAYPTQTCLPTVNNVIQCVSGTYDFNTGLLTSFTDANANTTTYAYDNRWRMTQALFPFTDSNGVHAETDFSYPNATSVHRSKRQNSGNWLNDYAYFDGVGRTVQTTLVHNGIGEYVDTTYDVLGRVNTVSNPHFSSSSPTDGITTSYYDALGRTTQVTKQDGSISSVQYDQASGTGNCTISTDEAGKKRKACTDGLGRLTSVWEDPSGLNFETDYRYDTLGNLLRVDQKGSAPGDSSQWRTRLFTYDSLSRLLTTQNPESGTISYSYDADGNMVTKTAPAPNQLGSATVTTTYTYDVLNRLTKKAYSDGKTPIAGYAYDLSAPWGWQLSNYIGRLVIDSTTDPQSNTLLSASQYNHDSMGRVMLNELGAAPNMSAPSLYVAYTFDLAGEVTAQTEAQSGVFNVTYGYSYDTAGRVTGMTSSLADPQHPATLASNITYDATGGMQQMTYGNGLTATDVYNKRLQPCRGNVNSSGTVLHNCSDPVPASGNVQDFNYGFNSGSANNGNVVSMTASGNQAFNRSYTYDSLNWLASMSAPGDQCSGLTWTYDAWGNRTDQTVTGGTCNAFHNPATTKNQLSGSPYVYDAAGNLINDGNHTYTYDAENRIISVDNGATTYNYDAQGHRVTKTTSAGWRNYLYDTAGRAVAETTSPGWQVGYGYVGGQLLTQYRDSTTYFFQHDHLGSTRILTALNQNVYDSMDYLPYGEQIAGATGSSHKYGGHERDGETGLDYMLARYYSNPLGKFLTPDWAAKPITVPYANFGNPQSLNLYAYTKNNPTTFGDPDGHCPPCGVEVLAGGDVSVSGAFWGAGSVLLPGVLGGGLANTSINTVAGNNYIKANATLQEIHATNQLHQAQAKAAADAAKKGSPPPGTQTKTSSPARPGTLGKPDHQATVEQERQRVDGRKEVTIDTAGGSKDSRRADVVGTNPETGATEIVQVYRPTPAGNVPQREQQAAQDIQDATGVKPTMVPVRPVPEKQEQPQ